MLWIIIPARRGSTGVPDKNIRPLPDGTTCMVRAIEVAASVGASRGGPWRVVVTTDYPFEARGAIPSEVLRRPPILCTAGAGMMAVLIHALTARETPEPDDLVCLLQPTSPFRTPDTVSRCLSALEGSSWDSGCTAQEVPTRWHPRYILGGDDPLPATRQSLTPVYRPDGGCYVSTVRQILTGSWGSMGWIVSPAHESLSIDTPEDWAEAERRIRGAG